MRYTDENRWEYTRRYFSEADFSLANAWEQVKLAVLGTVGMVLAFMVFGLCLFGGAYLNIAFWRWLASIF